MTTTEEIYQNGLLADAAYLDFATIFSDANIDISQGYGGIPSGSDALKEFQKRGFTEKQFEEFIDRYEIIEHVPNDVYGFSATLFKDTKNKMNLQNKLTKLKSDFLANMSHELRTPLNSVIGYTVRLLKKSENYDARQISSLNAIERNGKHLLAMINDILDLSKIEANKLELRFEKFVLHNLCENVIDQLQTNYLDKNLEFSFDFMLTKNTEITSDPLRLSQVLINLISNSIKYTEQGWVKLSVERNGNTVVFIIADSGIGIKDEDMKKLFNRFEQFDSDTRFNIGHGTGLGLAIVDNLTRLLGAQISAKSEYTVGSEFTVVLPINHSLIATAEPLFAVLEFGYKTIKDYQQYLLQNKIENLSKKAQK